MIYEIYLLGTIGADVNGDYFAQNIREIAGYSDCESIDLHINSLGGDLTQAMSIYNAINTCGKPVTTFNDFIAASCASLLALSGTKRIASENATYMLHKAFYDNNPAKVDPMLEAVNSAIIRTYAQILSITDAEAESKYLHGTDVVITAQQALTDGLINEIKPLAQPAIVANAAYVSRIVAQAGIKNLISANVELANPIYTVNMEDNKTVHAEKEIEASDTIAQPELSEKTDEANDYQEFIEAVLDGENKKEIKEVAEPEMVVIAKAHFDTILNELKEIKDKLNSKPAIPASFKAQIQNKLMAKANEFDGWDHRRFEKENPKELSRIKAEEPTRYQMLYEMNYGKK